VKHPSNPIVSGATRSHVFKHGNTYFMYAILIPGGFSKLSSVDGITWSTLATGILASGDPESFDPNGPANVFMWIESGVWYLLYEAGDGTVYRIGLATAPDGVTLTKSGSNPVMNISPGSVSHPFVVKGSAAYYSYVHVASSGVLPTDIAKFKTTDLVNWTRYPEGLSIPRTTADEGAGSGAGQLADVCVLEVGNDVWLFCTAMSNGAQATGHIKAFRVAEHTLVEVAGSLDGLVV
jgi:hypothetical protein